MHPFYLNKFLLMLRPPNDRAVGQLRSDQGEIKSLTHMSRKERRVKQPPDEIERLVRLGDDMSNVLRPGYFIGKPNTKLKVADLIPSSNGFIIEV